MYLGKTISGVSNFAAKKLQSFCNFIKLEATFFRHIKMLWYPICWTHYESIDRNPSNVAQVLEYFWINGIDNVKDGWSFYRLQILKVKEQFNRTINFARRLELSWIHHFTKIEEFKQKVPLSNSITFQRESVLRYF